MDVVSICPLQVGSQVWQPRPSLWVLTVACRATFYLLPGPARLSRTQEPVHALDQHRNGDPTRGLVCPGDLAPFKPRADVMLVGSAFAPQQQPVRALRVRLAVGAIDKSIEVAGSGAPFVSMPLLAPGGFGPVAPGSPGRVAWLGRHVAGWSHGAWHERPLPEDVDRAYFNAAPPDQQLDALRGDERITLQNLHPSYPDLETTLPGLRPRVMVRRPGAPPEEVAMTCDTLWIDTDRSLCTLTWRGRVMLDHPAQPGRVGVSMEKPDGGPGTQAPRARVTEDVTVAPLPDQGPALPFVAAGTGRAALSEEMTMAPRPDVGGPATPFERGWQRPVAVPAREEPAPPPIVVAPPALIAEPPALVSPPPLPPPEPPAAVAPPEPEPPAPATPEPPGAKAENILGPGFAAAMARARELKRPR